MRLDSRSQDDFIQILNKKNEDIQQELLSKILELTKTVERESYDGRFNNYGTKNI